MLKRTRLATKAIKQERQLQGKQNHKTATTKQLEQSTRNKEREIEQTKRPTRTTPGLNNQSIGLG